MPEQLKSDKVTLEELIVSTLAITDALMAELKEMKRQTREQRKEFWMRRSEMALPLVSEGTQDIHQARSVDPGANTAAVFQQQPSDSRIESPITRNDSVVEAILSH